MFIIDRFRNESGAVYYRCDTIEVDLNDLRAASIFLILGCDGTLHLNLTNKKSRVCYLSGSETLVS